ncbi:MAG TPA: hypothetical protein VFL83_08960 [Anaeromyxobacter sp.]|nr:hypothetical protein [Anaeromyxobacter sp.]
MKKTLCIALLSTIAFLAAPLRADASTITECLAVISTLRLQTDAVTFAREELGAKLESQLLFHLDKASAELDKADLWGARKQLDNYSTTVERGARAEKILAEDAAALQAGVAGALACVDAII